MLVWVWWKGNAWKYCTVGGHISWYKYYRNCIDFLKKLKIELLHDLSITRMRMYPKEINYYFSISLPFMCIAQLFKRATKWKWSKCLLTSKWIRKMWSIYEYYSAIKKKEPLLLTTTKMIRHRKTNTVWPHLHMDSKERKPNSRKQRV